MSARDDFGSTSGRPGGGGAGGMGNAGLGGGGGGGMRGGGSGARMTDRTGITTGNVTGKEARGPAGGYAFGPRPEVRSVPIAPPMRPVPKVPAVPKAPYQKDLSMYNWKGNRLPISGMGGGFGIPGYGTGVPADRDGGPVPQGEPNNGNYHTSGFATGGSVRSAMMTAKAIGNDVKGALVVNASGKVMQGKLKSGPIVQVGPGGNVMKRGTVKITWGS